MEQRLALWAEVFNASEELLLAGLRRQVGPEGDLLAAYRSWYAEYRAEHERGLRRMLERLARCEQNHGP
ncbi:MAG: hypothetical protein L0Z62_41285 [Gemmataceae bacterium]|nr:hypothetical protein [Gemmataceae bacterium]